MNAFTIKENLTPRQRRQAEAIVRQEAHDKLTLEEKLNRAIENGHQNTKEVKKLRAKIQAASNTSTNS